MRKPLIAILYFSAYISFAQNLKIVDAELRTHITREEPNKQQVAGFVDLTAEIENLTNDTLYLIARSVEPFIDYHPFQFNQVRVQLKNSAIIVADILSIRIRHAGTPFIHLIKNETFSKLRQNLQYL